MIVRRIEPVRNQRKQRVAAYARVSTDQDEQQESFETQVAYYTSLIRQNPDWEFVKVYADGDTPYGLPAKGRCIAILPKVARFDVFPYGSESRRYWCLP